MLRMLFNMDREKLRDKRQFNLLYKEILKLKKLDKPGLSPDFIGLQDERGRMLLLALSDEDRWVLQTLETDWGTQFGKIDQARDLGMQEVLLNDEELRKTLETFITEGKLSMPSRSRGLG